MTLFDIRPVEDHAELCRVAPAQHAGYFRRGF
jgi:hypothetical protein